MAVKIGLKFIEIWKESMEDEVLAYEKEAVETGKIVFYGPSYFTRWSTRFGMRPLADCLKGKSGSKCVINRGFGSSCPEHQLYYYPRMIRPLAPKVLVYCPYGNGVDFGYSLEESWELAQRVIAYAQTDFPDITIYLVGAVPKRDDYNEAQVKANDRFNAWLRNFAQDTPNCHYVDVMSYEPLASRKDIYVEDGIHFNQDGYDIFEGLFRTALQKELEQY